MHFNSKNTRWLFQLIGKDTIFRTVNYRYITVEPPYLLLKSNKLFLSLFPKRKSFLSVHFSSQFHQLFLQASKTQYKKYTQVIGQHKLFFRSVHKISSITRKVCHWNWFWSGKRLIIAKIKASCDDKTSKQLHFLIVIPLISHRISVFTIVSPSPKLAVKHFSTHISTDHTNDFLLEHESMPFVMYYFSKIHTSNFSLNN